MGQLTEPEYVTAGGRLDQLRRSWREIKPNDALRTDAERLLIDYSLKAGDSLQLAAAVLWSFDAPQSRTFIAGDAQLIETARQVGFQTLTVP